MRIRIRLDGRKNVLTENGYPVVIYISKNNKDKPIRTGYFSKLQDWDKINALPKKSHPQYLELLNYLEAKKIQIGKLLAEDKLRPISFSAAVGRLALSEGKTFYEQCTPRNRPQRVALENFNKAFPEIYPHEITPDLVVKYMEYLLTTPVRGRNRSPNGVISYLNSLTALWNKTGRENNPFKGIRPRKRRTPNKALSDSDMLKIINHGLKPHPNSKGGGIANYLNYFLLCFYLGGIDMVDLANLTKDNIVNGRIEFYRAKGGTDSFISNKILPQAQTILDMYRGQNYLVPLKPIYANFINNINRYLPVIQKRLKLSKKPYSKAARYTFITRAQMLLIDQRITADLVGHSQTSTHFVYMDQFPEAVRDQAHNKIISIP